MSPFKAEAIQPGRLLERAESLKYNGWRMIGISVVCVDRGCDLIYHFDKDLRSKHLRLKQKGADPIPSLSPVFPGAFMPENEAQDQFGLSFTDLDPDYEKTFFLESDAESAPLCPGTAAQVEEKESDPS